MTLRSSIYRRLALRGNVRVGEHFHIGPFSRIWAPQQLNIGFDVYVGKFVTIEVDGSIGNGTLIANNVGIVGRKDHDIHQAGVPIRRAHWIGNHGHLSQPVSIGHDVWIGFGAIVLSGVSVGDSAVIAAGALVTDDVEPNSIVGGVPARKIAERFDEKTLVSHWAQLRERGVITD
jgi:acetyltransferase-like isoleucine patch superfamily enzyme